MVCPHIWALLWLFFGELFVLLPPIIGLGLELRGVSVNSLLSSGRVTLGL